MNIRNGFRLQTSTVPSTSTVGVETGHVNKTGVGLRTRFGLPDSDESKFLVDAEVALGTEFCLKTE